MSKSLQPDNIDLLYFKGCKDKEIRKSEFLERTQLLCENIATKVKSSKFTPFFIEVEKLFLQILTICKQI